jgi:hypothetical protein
VLRCDTPLLAMFLFKQGNEFSTGECFLAAAIKLS